MDKIYEYIAKQLNDHEAQCHGRKQGSYTSWSLDHIKDAVQCGVNYLYSIHPKAFPTQTLTMQQDKDSCVISMSCVPCKVLDVISIGEGSCANVITQSATETNSLLSMLKTSCVTEPDPANQEYALKKLSDDTYLSDSIIEKGTEITFLCSSAGDVADLPANFIAEYSSLIKNYALWQLLLTDNESRTNQIRWESYFKAVQWFVETKLLLEFSLTEDDYELGRRKVDDR